MIRDPRFRQCLRNYLIIANIVLGTILLALLFFETFVFRPEQISLATALKQYVVVDLEESGRSREESIKPDYLGQDAVKILSGKQSDSDGVVEAENPQDEKLKPVMITPKIAIIVTGLGLNKRSTELSLTLPREVDLGFLPYTASLKPLMNQALEEGHDIYLYVPFESSASSGAQGRYDITSEHSMEENLRRLSIILGSQKQYKGIYTSYKEHFTSNPVAFSPIFDKIKENNLTLVLGSRSSREDSWGSGNIIQTSIVIDEEVDKDSISKNLEKLTLHAKQHKKALGYCQGYVLTINMIKEWIPLLKKEGIELVPISVLKN